MKNQIRRLAAVLLVVLVVFTLPITANAESIYIESKGITVNLKDEPTETVVEDKGGILTSEDLELIIEDGKRLKIYNIGLYIEMIDEKECNQRHANEMAEIKYAELMPEENSIMIVFSFYKEAEGYYAVHYNVQGDLSESKISGIIHGTYHDFKTDSSWIRGSFVQVVSYLMTVEDELIHADEIAAQKKAKEEEFHNTFLKVLRIVFECLGLATIAFLVIKNVIDRKEYKEEIEKRRDSAAELSSSLMEKEKENDVLNKEVAELKKWKKNAISADPKITERITTFLAKSVGELFSGEYESATSLEDLDRMIRVYDGMTDEEKSFVSLNVDEARERLNTLAQEKATEATKYIEEVCSNNPDRHSYSAYDRGVQYYNGLPLVVRLLIAQALINNLKSGQDEARTDLRRYNDSQSYYHRNNSSSTISHSSYGGFHSGTFGGRFGGGH